MLGAGLQFDRSRNGGGDRFYSAVKARRSRRDEPSPVAPASLLVPEPPPLCNLERFLESVTPSVSAQYLSKMTVRDWRTCNVEFQPFFLLSDLWASFKEWSAYGVGVPLVLSESDNAIQYYVPYLSGIQLYADQSKSTTKSREFGEESDGEYCRDSSSDGSSDSEQHMAFQEDFSSDEGESGNSRGCLLFEYFARDQPYCREPLADKISDLALHFPELKMLRSCDLLPSSWISVAWQ